MTSMLFQDFNERSKEVSKYFMFLKSLEEGTTKLTMQGKGGISKIKQVDSDLIKTLKASGFLLLYNLVEATMRNSIEAIFEELQNQGISYDQIRPELKKIVLKNFKKLDSDAIFSSIQDISIDIITVGFDKKKLFSGNIDGKKIRETATEYGFSYRTDHNATGDGTDLLTIKTNRNDLAHGWKSFAEVGRDKSAGDLLRIKKKTIRYLKEIVQNVEQYLSNQDYLGKTSINAESKKYGYDKARQ